jgi:serine/threonine-protein kinase
LTVAGRVLGTREYMSPEQVISSASANHLSDIYSLGCALHVLLTGRPPYNDKSRSGLAAAHLRAPIPSLKEQRAEVPPAVEEVFRRMLAKDPEKRPQSMDEVIGTLQRE